MTAQVFEQVFTERAARCMVKRVARCGAQPPRGSARGVPARRAARRDYQPPRGSAHRVPKRGTARHGYQPPSGSAR